MNWKESISKAWSEKADQLVPAAKFPLIFQNFNEEDVVSMVEVIMSGQLTMSKKVREFETQFAQWIGSPYAVMVNSGSSANLLAVAAAINPMRKNRLKEGDEVLVPAVCWSTSVWPLMQLGLKPVFVDIDSRTLNIDLKALKAAITPKTKALMAVHILGNSGPMSEVVEICKANNLMLLEDTCESLGSVYAGKALGTLGAFGTYSFYYSHHMTTGEGGMVTCQTLEDYDLLKCIRAHGWSRELSNKQELEKQHHNIDSRFLFVNTGFNLRPMEIQAALGMSQLKRLKLMNENRIQNNDRIIAALKSHSKWNNQFEFVQQQTNLKAVWFGMCFQLTEKFQSKKSEYLNYLTSHGVENRPIVSGNFVRQPAFKLYGLPQNPDHFPEAEKIDRSGFFIGVHTEILSDQQVKELTQILLSFEF